MRFVISVQCFKSNSNRFVVKECAISSVDEEAIRHWVVKPPFEYSELDSGRRREASHLTHDFHGLKWDDGDIEYEEWLRSIREIADRATSIYAKGSEITLFLSTLLGLAVTNLEELNCPSVRNLTKPQLHCFHHNLLKRSGYRCALADVTALKHWLYHYEHPSIGCGSGDTPDSYNGLRSQHSPERNAFTLWHDC